jgi:vancomycin resistance protein YoaR
MQKWWKKILITTAFSICCMSTGLDVKAVGKDSKIEEGVKVGNIDVSGMSISEAEGAVGTFVESLKDVRITLRLEGGQDTVGTAGEFGITWEDGGELEEAAMLGKRGNIVQRYKTLADLKREGRSYPLNISFGSDVLDSILNSLGETYDQEAVDASLTKTESGFQITEGQTGRVLDVAKSKEAVLNYLQSSWDYGNASIDLVVTVEEPKGNAETLNKVKDVLGTYTTSYKSSGPSRVTNVRTGCNHINGVTLYPGEQCSVLDLITPFSVENGYELAGSYLNGQVVNSLGGGICQVSTTLYNAVLNAELQVDERSNHSMIVTYVDPSADAAISESGGKDFKFTNNKEYPIYIEGTTTSDKTITFTIYGVEDRSSDRKVEYVSEVLETNVPPAEKIIPTGDPVGYVNVQSVHVGYKARLWKVVTENGVEVSREQVNSSSYAAVPRTASVGTATADPNVAAQIQAAIATGSIDYVKSVAGALAAQEAAAAAAAGQQIGVTEDMGTGATDG